MIAADGACRRIVVAALLLLAPVGLAGQVPDSAQPAPTRPSDNPDDRYTELQQRVNVQLPVLPRLAEGAPEPGFARIVFDRDSIEWVNAATVGDLLARVPGVFIWRGGRRGTPEVANYQARGATSVQYVLDGMPYVPAGPDSVSVDPALFALNFLDRVEIERWPGRLEVRLYTRQHDRRITGKSVRSWRPILNLKPLILLKYRAMVALSCSHWTRPIAYTTRSRVNQFRGLGRPPKHLFRPSIPPPNSPQAAVSASPRRSEWRNWKWTRNDSKKRIKRDSMVK